MKQVFIGGLLHNTDDRAADCINALRDELDDLRGEVYTLRAHLERARLAHAKLMDYRRRNLFNWQMEKADDFFREIGIALEPEEAQS